MGNRDYPGTDLNLRQNSKFKIFKCCFLEIFVLGSNLPKVAPFPTTNEQMHLGYNFVVGIQEAM